MEPLPPLTRELLAGPNFGVVATRSPDGSIQQTVVWLRECDGEIEFSSFKTRAKLRNLERDPTASVLVIDRLDGYRFTAVRGEARLVDEGAFALIDELSVAYDGVPWPEEQPWKPRTRVIITPTKVHERG